MNTWGIWAYVSGSNFSPVVTCCMTSHECRLLCKPGQLQQHTQTHTDTHTHTLNELYISPPVGLNRYCTVKSSLSALERSDSDLWPLLCQSALHMSATSFTAQSHWICTRNTEPSIYHEGEVWCKVTSLFCDVLFGVYYRIHHWLEAEFCKTWLIWIQTKISGVLPWPVLHPSKNVVVIRWAICYSIFSNLWLCSAICV